MKTGNYMLNPEPNKLTTQIKGANQWQNRLRL